MRRPDYGHCTGAVNPPSLMSSGELPTSRGISPVMGPPFAAGRAGRPVKRFPLGACYAS